MHTKSYNQIEYKAKISGLPAKYNTNLCDKRCVLPISVNNTSQLGEKLKASLALINRRFAFCDIIIADTLQMHNYLNKYPSNQAFQFAKDEGTQWMKENKIHLNELESVSGSIIGWEECKQHSEFQHWQEILKVLYQENHEYKLALDDDIKTFIYRNNKNHPQSMSTPNIIVNSFGYILEETSVMLSYFIDKKYNYILYPGTIPKSIKVARSIIIDPSNIDLVRDLKIYFRKKKH